MGKASLIYVIGLSFIIAYAMLNINAAGTDAMTNYTNYYIRTMSRNIASSGANIGCEEVFMNPAYNTPYNNISFQDGKMNIWFVTGPNKKYVYASGTVTVGPITISDTVIAELRDTTLARYAWFTNLEANSLGQVRSWNTGDTAFGPVHTNDKFNIVGPGKPVFKRKATAWQAAVAQNNKAEWQGGYEWGIKIPYPTNLDNFKNAAISGGRVVSGLDAKVTFNNDGSVRLQYTAYDSTFENATAFAANGAFAVIGGNLTVEGTVVGDLAIGALKNGVTGGQVNISGDITYNWDPEVIPTSTDKLGIYATGDIVVKYDNSDPTAYYDRKIYASIFSLNGALEVENFNNYPRGKLTTYGAFMQYYRGGIGTVVVGTGTLTGGYRKNFRYDSRLENSPPKFYPSMNRYTLYAWREN